MALSADVSTLAVDMESLLDVYPHLSMRYLVQIHPMA